MGLENLEDVNLNYLGFCTKKLKKFSMLGQRISFLVDITKLDNKPLKNSCIINNEVKSL